MTISFVNIRKAARMAVCAILLIALFANPINDRGEAAAAPVGGFTSIQAGSYYSIGLRGDGSLWTWGRNLMGELGLQTEVTFGRTAAPVRLQKLPAIAAIATSGDSSAHQLALGKDGSVWQWGGTGLPKDGKMRSVLPRQIQGVKDAIALASGERFGAVILRDGKVQTWQRVTEANPVTGVSAEVSLTEVSGLRNIVQLAAAGSYAAALNRDGSVWVWDAQTGVAAGSASSASSAGSVGSASSTSSTSSISSTSMALPRKVNGLPVMRSISASGSSMYAVDARGTAWRWTINRAAGSGGSTASAGAFTMSKAEKLHPELQVKQVQAAQGYYLLLTTDGEVWSFGRTVTGREGKVHGLANMEQIAAGTFHSQAIDRSGEVWGWGADKWNELGIRAALPDGMVYSPVRTNAAIDVIVFNKPALYMFPATMNDQTVMLPAKEIANALGAVFAAQQTDLGRWSYTISYKGETVVFELGSKKVLADGKPTALPVPVGSLDGAITVPHTMLDQLFSLQIGWEQPHKLSIN